MTVLIPFAGLSPVPWKNGGGSTIEIAIGPPDAGFENFDWRTVAKAREALEGIGIGYGKQGAGAGRFYEYQGDPVARGVGTPVANTLPG